MADTAMSLIDAERQRQISVEGYSAAHDAEHDNGEIRRAGMCYLSQARIGDYNKDWTNETPMGWPWASRFWKPKNPKADLIRAGALFLAERDRLKRLNCYHGHVDHKIELTTRLLTDAIAPPLPDREEIAETIWRAEYRRATGKERLVNWGDGVSAPDKESYRYLADAIMALREPGEGAATPDLQSSNPKEWADRIERTARLRKVVPADSYAAAMHMAVIDCFYDFEAKQLVQFLRGVAATSPPAQAGGKREARSLSDRRLWDEGCLTRWQLDNWTDEDFAKHVPGIRKTVRFLFDRLDTPTNRDALVEALRKIAALGDGDDDPEYEIARKALSDAGVATNG